MSGVVFIFVILTVAFALNFGTKQEELEVQRSYVKAKEEEEANSQKTKAQKEESRAAHLQAEAEIDKKEAEVARAVAKKTRDDAIQAAENRSKQIDELSKLLKERDDARNVLLDKLTVSLRRRGVKVEVDKENGVIRLPEELLFQSGEAVLQQNGIEAISKIADELYRELLPLCNKGRLEAFFVEGHTDDAKITLGAKFKDNWELSTARAVNTANELTKQRPELNRLLNPAKQPILGVSGYGDQRPVVANKDKNGIPDQAAMKLNRRIDLRFLMAYPKADDEMKRVKDLLNQPKLK